MTTLTNEKQGWVWFSTPQETLILVAPMDVAVLEAKIAGKSEPFILTLRGGMPLLAKWEGIKFTGREGEAESVTLL